MTDKKSPYEKAWLRFKCELRKKHPDWPEDRISRTAARKVDRMKRMGI